MTSLAAEDDIDAMMAALEGGPADGAKKKKNKKKKKKKKVEGEGEGAAGADGEGKAAEAEGGAAAAAGEEGEGGEGGEGGAAKKKKKKKKKKKGGGGGGGEGKGDDAGGAGGEASVLPEGRNLGGFCDSYRRYGQTHPPTIPITELFKGKPFPEGEMQIYSLDSNAHRIGSAELKEQERLESDLYSTLREAGEVHRQVRRYAQSFIKPGIKLKDMCAKIEDTNRALVQEAGLKRGVGFPTGCSINSGAYMYK